jgi:hypothetical protein
MQPFRQREKVPDVEDDSSIQVVEQNNLVLSPSGEPTERWSKDNHPLSPHVKVHCNIFDSPASSLGKSEKYLQLDLSSMDGAAQPVHVPSFLTPTPSPKGKLQKNFSRLLHMSPSQLLQMTRVRRKSAAPIPLSPIIKNSKRESA